MDKVYRQGKLLFLTGTITEDNANELINHILVINMEDDAKDKIQKEYIREPIMLYINSPGGRVTDTLGVADIMLNSRTTINTYGIVKIFSAALILFLCGKNRYMYSNTDVLIHSGSENTYGTTQHVKEQYVRNRFLEEKVNTFFIEHTTLSLEKLNEISEKQQDWYLTAEEALAYEIPTEIIKNDIQEKGGTL